MEDDQRNLIPGSGAGTAPQPERESCSRESMYAVASVLVTLLIAGQAVTVFFVYHHNERITKLSKDTTELKLESIAKKLPRAPQPVMKMAMANMMPMAIRDDEFLKNEAKLTNSTEDQVKRVLLRENPLRKFPEFNSSFIENIGQMRFRMDYEDWKAFETWMHKWLLFQMAQNVIPEEKGVPIMDRLSQTEKPYNAETPNLPTEIGLSQVKTKCQREECGKGVYPGRFCAQCDEMGNYLPKQCHRSTGYCWCVYNNGTAIEGTQSRGPLDCDGEPKKLDPDNVTFSGVEID